MTGGFIRNVCGQWERRMPEARSQVFIDAPPEEVWALISDVGRGPEWSVVTLECELTSEGPPGLGCTYRSVSKFVASKITTEQEIVEWVPPRRIVSRAIKGAESTLTQTCEPQGEGSVLTMCSEFTFPSALPALVADKVAQQVTNTLTEELACIKKVVEERYRDAGSSPAGSSTER
jgi:uncharacterized protein YndB with AHSA1/START domain